MKYLFLGRHSKSLHEIERIKDIDRPLNQRGYDDAYLMARFISEQKIKPELIISSPAIRAFSSARIYSDILKLKTELRIEQELYFNEKKYFEKNISFLPNELNALMLIGHNSGIHIYSELLSGSKIAKFPTSAIICIEFSTFSWDELKNSDSRVIYFQYPSKLKNNE